MFAMMEKETDYMPLTEEERKAFFEKAQLLNN